MQYEQDREQSCVIQASRYCCSDDSRAGYPRCQSEEGKNVLEIVGFSHGLFHFIFNLDTGDNDSCLKNLKPPEMMSSSSAVVAPSTPYLQATYRTGGGLHKSLPARYCYPLDQSPHYP